MRVVQRRQGVSNGFLREVNDFKDVYGCFGGAFDTCLDFLTTKTLLEELDETMRILTLNSFIIGAISSSSASFDTIPLRKSILFPTRMTGT